MSTFNKFSYNLCLIGISTFLNCSTVPTDVHEKVFTDIYTYAKWGRNNKGQGYSGGGSLLQNAQPYVSYLRNFIKSHNIQSVVDAGCGDWEFSRYIDWSGIDYKGYDVVEYIIEKNIQNYSKKNVQFFHANFLATDLPSADLLVCKEVLQHLKNEDIFIFLQQLPKFKYCLINNEVDPRTYTSKNTDIKVGDTHTVDLSQPPFNIMGEKVLNYWIAGELHQVFLITTINS